MADIPYKWNGPRAEFKPDLFEKAIETYGLRVIWQKSMLCPCLDSYGGQPQIGCPSCRGKGYLYFDPIETRVLLSSISGNKEQDRIGLQELGSAYATFKASDEVGYRDRIMFVDSTIRFSEIRTRSTPNAEGKSIDSLSYKALSVVSVRTMDKVINSTDFSISQDGLSLQWNKGVSDVAVGQQYSVLYVINPSYIAMNPLHEIRGTYTTHNTHGFEKYVPLPKQFMIKREDFVKWSLP